jgi:GWxTD domain-containing protein
MCQSEGRVCSLTALAILLLVPALGRAQQQSTARPRGAAGKATLGLDGGVPVLKTWLDEDVVWIISSEERAAFKLLKDDEERDLFVEAFWARRNPTPDVFNNEFQVEHYRRIAYANTHFGTGIPGWKTDRGRIYIVYGPPDKIDSYPTGLTQENPPDGADASPRPLEVWRYRYLEGVGQEVVIDFVDVCSCGEYQMKIPPELKDALLYVPGGLVGEHGRREEPGDARPYLAENPPRVRFKDLEKKVNAQPRSNTLPLEVTTCVTKSTDITSLVLLTITFQNRDLAFIDKHGSRRATLKIFGRVMTLTGSVAEVFEETPEIGPLNQPGSSPDHLIFNKTLALRRGRYGLEIAVEDANSDHWGTWIRAVMVGDR